MRPGCRSAPAAIDHRHPAGAAAGARGLGADRTRPDEPAGQRHSSQSARRPDRTATGRGAKPGAGAGQRFGPGHSARTARRPVHAGVCAEPRAARRGRPGLGDRAAHLATAPERDPLGGARRARRGVPVRTVGGALGPAGSKAPRQAVAGICPCSR
ncbi:hypothetical protein G6F22_019525 [Rhizopus arrhizus]|nr:hypothetical protein G6F22_019525 [Rhizopus arrhizus]